MFYVFVQFSLFGFRSRQWVTSTGLKRRKRITPLGKQYGCGGFTKKEKSDNLHEGLAAFFEIKMNRPENVTIYCTGLRIRNYGRIRSLG